MVKKLVIIRPYFRGLGWLAILRAFAATWGGPASHMKHLLLREGFRRFFFGPRNSSWWEIQLFWPPKHHKLNPKKTGIVWISMASMALNQTGWICMGIGKPWPRKVLKILDDEWWFIITSMNYFLGTSIRWSPYSRTFAPLSGFRGIWRRPH